MGRKWRKASSRLRKRYIPSTTGHIDNRSFQAKRQKEQSTLSNNGHSEEVCQDANNSIRHISHSSSLSNDSTDSSDWSFLHRIGPFLKTYSNKARVRHLDHHDATSSYRNAPFSNSQSMPMEQDGSSNDDDSRIDDLSPLEVDQHRTGQAHHTNPTSPWDEDDNHHDATRRHSDTSLNNSQSQPMEQDVSSIEDNSSLEEIRRSQADIEKHQLTVEYFPPVGKDDELHRLKDRRIVDIAHLIEQSRRLEDHECVHNGRRGQLQYHKEIRHGLASSLFFKCKQCGETREVTTIKDTSEQINKASVAAMYSIGKGHYHLEEFLTHMGIPAPAYGTFRKWEDTLGQVWLECLTKEMEEAGKEEKQLAIEDGRTNEEGVAEIPVIADGGWSHRSYGHKYTAKSGCAIIIGKETKKLLFVGVRNKYCSICAIAERKKQPPVDHTCFKNWTGSSPAMEADIVVEGFQKSTEQHGVQYKVLIGDGDSSVLKSVQERVSYGRTVKKIDCINHLLKNVKKKLFKLQKKSKGAAKTFLSNAKIKKLTKYIRHLIENLATEGAEPNEVAVIIKNLPNHLVGDHRECPSAVCKDSGTLTLVNLPPSFLAEVTQIINHLATNVDSILANETTNLCEAFMHLVSKFTGGKEVFYGRRASFIWRVYGAALLYQHGQAWRSTVWEKMHQQGPSDLVRKVDVQRQRRNIINGKRKMQAKVNRAQKNPSPDDDFPFASKEDPGHADYGEQSQKPDMDEEQLAASIRTRLTILNLDENGRAELERATVGQTRNEKWHKERDIRLTASNFGKVCKRRGYPGDKVSQIMYSRALWSKAIEWGNQHEKVAIAEFEQHTGKKVRECGLFVHPEKGCLAASPDGLIEGEDAIIEVKCPLMAKDKRLIDVIKEKKSRFCLYIEEGEMRLNPKHDYMFQVQGQLAATRMNLCYFVVWSPTEIFIQSIPFDSEKWQEMEANLTDFFMSEMLPEMVDSRKNRSMPVRRSKAEAKQKEKAEMRADKQAAPKHNTPAQAPPSASIFFLRNGNHLPPVAIGGVQLHLTNTCPFDSIASILGAAMLNYKHYRDQLSADTNNDFVIFCMKLTGGAQKEEILRERANLLTRGKCDLTGPRHDINCAANVAELESLLESAPSAVRTDTCIEIHCNATKSWALNFIVPSWRSHNSAAYPPTCFQKHSWR